MTNHKVQAGRELQQIVSRPLKSGEEQLFELALTSDKIVQAPVESLKQALRYVMLKIGMRAQNLPMDEEQAILLEHLIKYYGNHTPDEIKLAFDLAITGQLSLKQKDVTSYENFSCLYVSSILNAYRIWAAERYTPPPLIQIEEQKVLTEEDYLNDQRESVELAYQRLLKDLDMNDELFPEYFYNILVRDGQIPEDSYEKKQAEAKQKLAHDAQVDRMHMESKENKEDGRMYNTKHIGVELDKLRKSLSMGKFGNHHPIVTVSKQLIVKEFFLDRMAKGFLNIYVKE
jgi:hypothetical protein